MNDKVGRKIKDLAKTISVIMIIFIVILGIFIMSAFGNAGVIVGIVLIVVGSVLAQMSMWLLYGFGELIDKAVDIEYNTRAIAYNTQKDNTQKDNTQKDEQD